MKRIRSLIIIGAFLFVSAGSLLAATAFTVRAVVPAATSVNITASSVTGTTWTSQGTTLAFGTMTYVTTVVNGVPSSIWRAPNYFAVDVANAGAGSPNVTVVYADVAMPVGQVHGLGYKGTIDFKKVVLNAITGATTETAISGHVKKALRSVASENVLPALTAGGWLRLYVGLADGAVGTVGEPFTAADQPGTYTGTLTITATVS